MLKLSESSIYCRSHSIFACINNMSHELDEARAVLIRGGDVVALAEAIGALISSPSSSLDDIRLGLRHGGLIAEQAAIEIRRREAASAPIATHRAAIH